MFKYLAVKIINIIFALRSRNRQNEQNVKHKLKIETYMEKHCARCWDGWTLMCLTMNTYSIVKPNVYSTKLNYIVKGCL